MNAHLKAQLLRFARISVLAFVTALPATGGKVSWASLFALLAGAAEAGLRQVIPVKEVPTVTAVLAGAAAAVAPPTTDPAPPTAKG